MGFFSRDRGPDVWGAGVQTSGTIERVMVTGWGRGGGSSSAEAHHVYLVISYDDPQDSRVAVELDAYLPEVPLPGSTVPIAYLPDNPTDTLDFKHHDIEGPDPSVPRGWSGGMFEIEPMGERCANPPDQGLDAERELFRTGRRLEAKVVDRHVKLLQFSSHGENQQFTLQLLADDTLYETQFWAHGECVPNKGDMIEIAVSPDGSRVAPDTDERYYGPPGRALVWAVAHERTEEGVREAATAQVNQRLQAELDRVEAMHAEGKIPDQAYAQVRANILGAMGVPAAPGAPPAQVAPSPQARAAQLAALEDMHAKGRLTDEQFEVAKTKLGV